MVTTRAQRHEQRLPRAQGLLALCGVLGVAAVAACSASEPDAGSNTSDIHPVDRRLVGVAAPYAPDRSLRAREGELASSVKERRRVAWEIVRRVLEPVARELPALPAPAGDPTAAPTPSPGTIKLPSFQTWYSARDFEALTAHVVGAMPKSARMRGDEVDATALDRAFPWLANEGALADPEWSDQRFFARRNELLTPEGAASVAGHETRTLMSPAFVRRLIEGYALADRCWNTSDGTLPPPPSPQPQDTASSDPASRVHAPCVRGGALPADAAIVKMSWIDARAPFRVYDTSADGLAKQLDQGDWGAGRVVDPPTSDRIYTMRRLSDPTRPDSVEQTMRLTGLHVATKELDHWVWITLWWSPDPDQDFGADRPEEFDQLASPWRNYKMCAVVDYDEGDADPEGGFSDTSPSLGAALRASREHGAGATPRTPRSWCSNPYLEEGTRNAPTNCIGCHQHGGLRKPGPTTIRNDEARFPDNTRRRVRTDFPWDYVWSMSSSAELARVLSDAVKAP